MVARKGCHRHEMASLMRTNRRGVIAGAEVVT
jgi:hypothetical protein